MNQIEIKELSYRYDSSYVLENINLNIEDRDFFAIIGPNGGGKSTLLKLILNILTPTKGNIQVDKSLLGYVPQNTTFNKEFPINVLDVVLMGLLTDRKKLFGYTKDEIELAYESLREVDMQDFAKQKIGNLSGGQRQRVLIARALCARPSILLLDEPTASIDVDGQQKIYELLKKLNKHMTIVVVSHDISIIANYASRVAYVNKRLHIHNELKTQNTKHLTHFCEVELLNSLKSCIC
jgi:zinc transport system ATP-binding protein